METFSLFVSALVISHWPPRWTLFVLQPFLHSLPFALHMQIQTLSCGSSARQPSILFACLHSRLLTGIAQGHCVVCALNYIRILMFCMLSPLGLLCTLPVWICLWLTCVSCHSFPLQSFFSLGSQLLVSCGERKPASLFVIHSAEFQIVRTPVLSVIIICVFFYSAYAGLEINIPFPEPLRWGDYTCESTHLNPSPNLGERVHFRVYYIAVSLDKV